MRGTRLLLLAAVACVLFACSPAEQWHTRVNITGHPCPRPLHTIRGPDAYDIEHGEPFHCEAPPTDPDFTDIDGLPGAP